MCDTGANVTHVSQRCTSGVTPRYLRCISGAGTQVPQVHVPRYISGAGTRVHLRCVYPGTSQVQVPGYISGACTQVQVQVQVNLTESKLLIMVILFTRVPTFAAYRNHLAKHCGIKYDDMIMVHNPNPDFPPVICVAVATNLSKRSKVPRADIIEKVKEFLGTEDEPKWYYIVRA